MKLVHEKVRVIKQSKVREAEYMKLQERDRKNYLEGRQEGIREGKEEGLREGMKKGKRQGELLTVIQMARAFISQGKELEILVDALDGNLDGNAGSAAVAGIVKQAAEMILKDEKLTDEEILMRLSEG